MPEENLFDMELTPEQKRQQEKERLDKLHKQKGEKICIDGTNFYEALSAWIKECRLGNLSRAMYWGIVLVRSDPVWFGKRICAFAGEDVSPFDLASYNAMMVTGMSLQQKCFGKANGEECARYITTVACFSKKFFQDGELGLAIEDCMRKAEHAIANGWKLKMPSYALDMHTRKGKRLGKRIYKTEHLNRGGADCRYSGNKEGRANMFEEYERNGTKLDESFDSKIQPPYKSDWE